MLNNFCTTNWNYNFASFQAFSVVFCLLRLHLKAFHTKILWKNVNSPEVTYKNTVVNGLSIQLLQLYSMVEMTFQELVMVDYV